MMMNCEQATRLMSDARERPLTLRERAAIKIHTLMCDGCNNFNIQVDQLGAIAHRYAKENDRSTDEPQPNRPDDSKTQE
jgi:predicted HNH restriction endonuclease